MLSSSPASLTPRFLPTYVAKSLPALIALLRAGWSRSLQRPVNFKGQALYINTPVAVCSPRGGLYPLHLPRIKAHKDQTCSPLGAAGRCQPWFPSPDAASIPRCPQMGPKPQSSSEGEQGASGVRVPHCPAGAGADPWGRGSTSSQQRSAHVTEAALQPSFSSKINFLPGARFWGRWFYCLQSTTTLHQIFIFFLHSL